MRSLATFVAVLAGFGLAAGVAEAGPVAKLGVTKVSVSPGKVAAGAKVVIKATVKNRSNGKAKAKLSVGIDPSIPPFASRRIGKVKAKSSKKVRLKLVVPGKTPPGNWNLQVCASPGKSCRASKSVAIFENSSYTKIEEAKSSGELSPGQALLFEMYALSGDGRLPKKYRGPGDIPSGMVFSNLASSFEGLPAADQARLFPYTLQPLNRGSAWGRSGKVRASASISAAPAPDCSNLEKVKGVWAGIKSEHAWFWFRTGRRGGQADAKRLAREFERTVWPKLTETFRVVDDASGAACDPTRDPRLDIFVLPKKEFSSDGGLTAPMILEGGCGPRATFIMLPEGASRSTLSHEFMHSVQGAYRVCDPQPAWVEGTATWAEDFVYPGDQGEHASAGGILVPYVSLNPPDDGAASGYSAWVLWYSIQKAGTLTAIQDMFKALETEKFATALESVSPGGLRNTWERFARQRFNQAPVGTAGFPEAKSFKAWDSFPATPLTAEAKLALNGAATGFVDLPTTINAFNTEQPPLSTFFHRVEITDEKVRHLEFRNDDFGRPGSMVQLFIRLASGRWRYEDISARETIAFCRDQVDQNVMELIVATSNASPRGEPLGKATHRLTGKNACGRPDSYSGTIDGNAIYDASQLGTGNSATASWNGTIGLTSSPGSAPSGYPAYFGVRLTGGGSVDYKINGQVNNCVISGQTTLDLAELGQFQYNIVTLTDATNYSIGVPFPQLTGTFNATYSNCDDPGDNGPAFWTVNAGVPSLVVPVGGKTVGPDGALTGTSSLPAGGGSPAQTTSWSLTPGG